MEGPSQKTFGIRGAAPGSGEPLHSSMVSVLDQVGAAVYTVDREWRFVYLNPHCREVLHRDPSKLLGRTLCEVLPELVGTDSLEQLHRAMTTQTPARFDFFAAAANRWFVIRAYPSAEGLSVIYEDVTAFRQVEADLRRALADANRDRSRLSALLRALPAGVIISDAGGRLVEFNDAAISIWAGQRPASNISEYDRYHGWWADSGEPVKPDEWPLARALRTGEPFSGDVVDIERFDGTRGTLLASAAPILDEDGVVTGGVVALLDITRYRAAELALRASEARFRQMAFAASDVLYDLDLTTRELRWYGDFDRALGYEPGAAPRDLERWLEHIHPEDRHLVVSAYRSAVAAQGELQVEHRVCGGDGQIRYWENRGTPIFDADGRLTRFVGACTDITDRRVAEARLRESEARLARVTRATTDAVWDWDIVADRIWWGDSMRHLFGYAPDAVTSINAWLRLIHPDDRERVLAEVQAVIDGGDEWSGQYRYVRADGEIVWVRDQGAVTRDASGRAVRMSGGMSVITEQVEAEQARKQSDARFRILAQNISDVITIYDASGIIRYASPSTERVLGYAPEDLIGTSGIHLVHPDDLGPAMALQTHAWQHAGTHPPIEFRMRHRDGGWRWLEVVITNLLHDPLFQGVITSSRDITERKEFEARLKQQAFHDALTGLPNRALFEDRLEHALSRQQRTPALLGVLFLDLDRFKLVNDSLGHAAGDELLVHVAARLKAALRQQDTLARFGGDEFVVLLEDLRDPQEAMLVAGRLLESLRAPVEIGTQRFVTSVSIGVALAAAERRASGVDLLREADIALYQAKAEGKARVAMFAGSQQSGSIDRLQLEADLRGAVERGELRVHYQPEADLRSGAIVGVEALMRWEHPVHGLLPPGLFIPIAEETGLIVGMERWALREACQVIGGLSATRGGEGPLQLSVNISARHLHEPDLVRYVARVLEETGFAAEALWLELTESVLIEELPLACGTLNGLRSLGIRLALDDFGTGYSSLTYLRQFPVDMLKIDRSFISNLDDSSSAAIVQAVTGLAHALGVQVTAEGVETEEQQQRIQQLGCDWMQGYLLAKPLPLDQLTALLGTRHT